MTYFFNILNNLLSSLLYKLKGGAEDIPPDELVNSEIAWTEPQAGWEVSKPGLAPLSGSTDFIKGEESGFLDVPTLLLEENEQAVLIVDHEFRDIPSWVEWDRTWQKLSIALMGGAIAELPLSPDVLRSSLIDRVRRLLLVTGSADNRISHFVSIIIRD